MKRFKYLVLVLGLFLSLFVSGKAYAIVAVMDTASGIRVNGPTPTGPRPSGEEGWIFLPIASPTWQNGHALHFAHVSVGINWQSSSSLQAHVGGNWVDVVHFLEDNPRTFSGWLALPANTTSVRMVHYGNAHAEITHVKSARPLSLGLNSTAALPTQLFVRNVPNSGSVTWSNVIALSSFSIARHATVGSVSMLSVSPYAMFNLTPLANTLASSSSLVINTTLGSWMHSAIAVRRLLDATPWTGTNLPPQDSVSSGSFSSVPISINVVALINGWLSGAFPNHGLVLDMAGTPSSARITSAQNGGPMPHLLVTGYNHGGIHPSLVSVGQNNIHLSWTHLPELPAGWRFQLFQGETLIYDGRDRTFNHTGLLPGTTYNYRLRVTDGVNHSGFTATGSWATIPVMPASATVTDIGGISWHPTEGRSFIRFTWPAVTGATGYAVWVLDGDNWRKFDVGNRLHWDSREELIYPSEAQIAGFAHGTRTADIFNRVRAGLHLRDNPNNLYRTAVNTWHRNDTFFGAFVTAYNASGEFITWHHIPNMIVRNLPNRTDPTPPTGGLSINSGMARTGSTGVTLSVTGTDPLVANHTPETTDDASGVSQMSFSNDNISWTPWETFAATRNWTITAGPGTKSVFMRLRDTAGNTSNIISGSIFLADDTRAPEIGLTINQGATTTTSSLVNLLINATDDLTPIEQLQMRLSNNGTTWTAWMPFATAHNNWSITSGHGATAGDGMKTVFLQVMDAMGNVNTTSRSIGFSATPPTGTVASSGVTANFTIGGSPVVAVFTRSAESVLTLTQSGAARMRFSMDGINWSPWEPAAASRAIAFPHGDGVRTAFVQFQNAFGVDSSVMRQTFVVDTTPPVLTLMAAGGATATRNSSVNLIPTVSDNISSEGFTYRFSLNGGTQQSVSLVSGQLTIPGLTATNTQHTITVFVTDQAGNTGNATIRMWRLP